MLCCSIVWAKIRFWFREYQNLQSLAVLFLYAQIACSLVGSLGPSHTGILFVNLAVALFALVAIESGSQTLGRTYAVLLGFSFLLDITWFLLFNGELRKPGVLFYFKLVFWMEVGGSVIRFLSAILWLQMYRLGAASSDQGFGYWHMDSEERLGTSSVSNLSSWPITQNNEEILGGSIYNPAYYSSLFDNAGSTRSYNEAAFS